MRCLLVLAASVAVLLVGASAASSVSATQGRWVIRDLGPCPGDCLTSILINDKGQLVIGEEFWQNGKKRDLGTLGGRFSFVGATSHDIAGAINNRGQVVGNSETRLKDEKGKVISHAFLWQNGRMRDLGVLPGYTHSEAVAINDRGQVVGLSCVEGLCVEGTAAFIWENGRMHSLGALPGDRDSDPVAINAKGWIVGTSGSHVVDEGGFQAVLWRNGKITGLGKQNGQSTAPTDANERGQIVGTIGFDGNRGVFLWQNGKLRRIIKTYNDSSPAIDDAGRVTGSTGLLNTRLFVWEKGKTRYLGRGSFVAANERGLIAASTTGEWDGEPLVCNNGSCTMLPLLPGHDLGRPEALNERNQIVGYSGTGPAAPSPLVKGRIVLWTYKS